MASGRFLSVSIAEDDKLGKLSIIAEYIYLKAIPHLDRDGLITGKPGLLYSRVCPTREELFGELQAIIDEWAGVGLVVRYTTEEGPVLFFRGFSKNNNLPHYERERPSRYAAPPGYYRTDAGLLPLGTEPTPKKVKKAKPDSSQPTSGDNPAKVQDEVQELVQDRVHSKVAKVESEEQEQDQEEDQDQDKDKAATLPAFLHEDEVDRDGRFTIQLIRDTNLFGYFKPDSRGRAANLEATYSMDVIRKAVEVLVERHNAMVEKTGNGIQDAVAFLAKILAQDFKPLAATTRVRAEVRLAPSEYYPNGHTKIDVMTLAQAQAQNYKIVERLS